VHAPQLGEAVRRLPRLPRRLPVPVVLECDVLLVQLVDIHLEEGGAGVGAMDAYHV